MTKTYPTDLYRTLLFLRNGDQLLLAMKKRGFGAGKWNGVGGKLEPGETVEAAMIRECQEEITVTPTSYRAIAELDFIQDASDNPWHMYVYAFVCDEWTGNPSETEEMAPQWFDLNNIPYDNMWEDDKIWLEQALLGHKLLGEFRFDEKDQLTSHSLQEVDNLTHD